MGYKMVFSGSLTRESREPDCLLLIWRWLFSVIKHDVDDSVGGIIFQE